MGRQLRVTCGACKGCPVIPLTREQWAMVSDVVANSTGEDQKVAKEVKDGESHFVFCAHEEALFVLRPGGELNYVKKLSAFPRQV